jgi:hypothetical protein
MSEENVPKLRLKPKLAAEPVIVPPPPVVAPAAPVQTPASPEPKAVRLKPKLAPTPAQESAPTPPAAPADTGALPPWGATGAFPPPITATDSPVEPLPPVEKSAAKFMLRPKAPPEAPPADAPAFPPPAAEIPAPAPVPRDTIPAPLFIDAEVGGGIPSTVPPSLTSRPFPPPPGNFPPPPGSENRPVPPWSQPKVAAKGSGGKFVKLGLVGLIVVAILGGGFFAYKKFLARRLPAEPVVASKPPEASAPAVEETKAETPPVEAAPKATVPIVGKAPPAPKPVEADEPPPPSAAFKAWVDNLRVGGVRAGANTRVFIGGTAYAPGEMVNPQLGITFEGYNAETRHLIFKDKTGATIQRRN